MRLIALTDSCYECSGPADILAVPDDMSLLVQMAEYQRWYHDEYLNPVFTGEKEYQSFVQYLCRHGAVKEPDGIQQIDLAELELNAPKLWTYERPLSEFEKMMRMYMEEAWANYMVKPLNIAGHSDGKTIKWIRSGG